MDDSFSKRLASLLSDALDSGIIEADQPPRDEEPPRQKAAADFAGGAAENDGGRAETAQKIFRRLGGKKKRAGEIIKNGAYNDMTKIPADVLSAFATLECPPDAPPETVRAAFRKKIKAAHPDSAKGAPAADARAEKLIAAHETIKKWLGV